MRARPSTKRLIVALSVSALAACGGRSGEAPPFFPTTAEKLDGFPGALMAGRIVARDDCVFVERAIGGPSALVLWPHGWDLEATPDGTQQVLDREGAAVLKIGDHVEMGGGFVSESRDDVAFPEELIGEPIPRRCRTAGGYWLSAPDIDVVPPPD